MFGSGVRARRGGIDALTLAACLAFGALGVACSGDEEDAGAGGSGAASGSGAAGPSTAASGGPAHALEIVFEGTGSGTVEVVDTSLSCDASCTLQVPPGHVALRAIADPGSSVDRFTSCPEDVSPVSDSVCSYQAEGDAQAVVRFYADGGGFPRRIGASGGESALAVALSPDGRVFVGGTSERRGDDAIQIDDSVMPLPVEDRRHAFVVALDADAKPLWAKAIGSPVGSVYQVGTFAIELDAAGNVFVGGNAGGASFAGSEPSQGQGAFVARFGQDGDLVWERKLPGYVRSLAPAGDGGVFVGGGNAAAFTLAGKEHCTNKACAWVARLSAEGEPLWARDFRSYEKESSTKEDIATFGLARTPEGDVMAAATINTGYFGYFDPDYGGGELDGRGYTDVLLARLDGDTGAHVWSRLFGSDSPDDAVSLDVDAAGTSTLLARGPASKSSYGGTPASSPPDGAWGTFARYDSAGTHLVSRHVSIEEVRALAREGEGFVVVGTFTGLFDDVVQLQGTPEVRQGIAVTLSAEGLPLSAERFGVCDEDAGAFAVDAAGGEQVVGGWFNGTIDFGGTIRAAHGRSDAVVHVYPSP